MAGENLAHKDLRRSNLSGADLTGTILSEANLADADLRQANLAGATFSFGTTITNIRLEGASLAGVSGSDFNRRCYRGQDFSGRCCIGANMCKADLSAVNFLNANLCEANIEGANLEAAKMREPGTKLVGVKGTPACSERSIAFKPLAEGDRVLVPRNPRSCWHKGAHQQDGMRTGTIIEGVTVPAHLQYEHVRVKYDVGGEQSNYILASEIVKLG